jgi:hypothetical protein
MTKLLLLRPLLLFLRPYLLSCFLSYSYCCSLLWCFLLCCFPECLTSNQFHLLQLLLLFLTALLTLLLHLMPYQYPTPSLQPLLLFLTTYLLCCFSQIP